MGMKEMQRAFMTIPKDGQCVLLTHLVTGPLTRTDHQVIPGTLSSYSVTGTHWEVNGTYAGMQGAVFNGTWGTSGLPEAVGYTLRASVVTNLRI